MIAVACVVGFIVGELFGSHKLKAASLITGFVMLISFVAVLAF